MCAESAAAGTFFFTSAAGIPVSTTHTITGGIVGVGASQRLSAVRWGVAGRVVWAWVFTIPGAAVVAGAVVRGPGRRSDGPPRALLPRRRGRVRGAHPGDARASIRWFAVGSAVLYVVLAVASWLDHRSRDTATARLDALGRQPNRPVM